MMCYTNHIPIDVQQKLGFHTKYHLLNAHDWGNHFLATIGSCFKINYELSLLKNISKEQDDTNYPFTNKLVVKTAKTHVLKTS